LSFWCFALSRKAFDFSNWTRIPTDKDCTDLLAQGYDTAIVGASFNPQLARQQIAVLVAHGFRIEMYAWLRHPWRADLLDAAINASYGFPVERMWLDVEDADDAMGKTPAQLEFDVNAALTYLESHLSVPVGIYTGDWFWDAYMATTNTFGCALYLANYVTDTSVLPPLPGGWTVLTIWQHAYHLTGTDFNADDDLILVEEDDMTPQQVQQLNEASGAVIRLQSDIDGLANALDALPSLKSQLRFLYAIAHKPWPFGA
jgi:Glycosyl hydrolases family 25